MNINDGRSLSSAKNGTLGGRPPEYVKARIGELNTVHQSILDAIKDIGLILPASKVYQALEHLHYARALLERILR